MLLIGSNCISFMHYLEVYEQLYVAKGREREQTLVDHNAVLLQVFLFDPICWQVLNTRRLNF